MVDETKRSCGSPNLSAEDGDVYALSTGVALPRSARFRSVSFFPATARGAARVAPGSVWNDFPQPPAVIYLRTEG